MNKIVHRTLLASIVSASLAAQGATDPLWSQPLVEIFGYLPGQIATDTNSRPVFSIDDMMFPLGNARGAIVGSSWPGFFHYRVDSSFTPVEAELIRQLVGELNGVAGFYAVENLPSHDRAVFTKVSGTNFCGRSYVGRIGGDQPIEIQCLNRYTIHHEVLHALGFMHEHQRPDRGAFLNVPANDSNCAAMAGSSHYTAFDFASIMMYPRLACGGMTARQPQPPGSPEGSSSFCQSPSECTAQMGGSTLSPRDRLALVRFYGPRISVIVRGQGSYSMVGVVRSIGPGGFTCPDNGHCDYQASFGGMVTAIATPGPSGWVAIDNHLADRVSYVADQNRVIHIDFRGDEVFSNGFNN